MRPGLRSWDATSQEFGWVPPAGNQFNATENMKIRRIPIKNEGREKVVSEDVTQKLSEFDPRLRDVSIPITVPITSEKTVDVPSRSSVLYNFPVDIISVATGKLDWMPIPKLKVSMFLT